MSDPINDELDERIEQFERISRDRAWAVTAPV